MADHGEHAHHVEPSQAGHQRHGERHDQHAGHSVAMFRDRFWLSLLLTVPIIFFSDMVQEWFGYQAPAYPGSSWLAPILGSVVFLYGGSPFLRGAVGEVRDRQPGMMLLIAMAIVVAYGASAATSLGWFDLEFWWELAALITIMLLGHWMEMRAVGQARGALAALAELLPDEAVRIRNGDTEIVPIAELVVGDLVLVRPGSRVPADGVITEGEGEVDESMVTGESKPVVKVAGNSVIAGTVAIGSAVWIRISAVGDDTTLAGIQRLVAQAQGSKSRAQVLADRAAAFLFYVAVTAAIITATAWLVADRPDQAVERTVSVLVIACPHALGLAIPLVIAISTGLAARNGILIKDRLALERMRRVDIVLFDKTGTLTKGSHRVSAISAAESREAVDQLHRLGVQVAMITGDARQVAEAVGAELNIDEVFAEVLPEDKHAMVAQLQARGSRVAMVGDGVNDAPALAQADVGIAIGAGTDVAIESAGIVLASGDPRGVVAIRRLSQAGYRKMVENLVWATGYNVVAIPLAAGAMAWAGVLLAPAAAAALMSLSTVIVAVNAQLLRAVDLRSP